MTEHPVFPAETGDKLGTSYGRATIIKVLDQDASLVLETTFDLRGRGKLVIYDATRYSRLDEVRPEAVIGGTDEFANARGSASTVEGDCADGKGALITFDLIMD